MNKILLLLLVIVSLIMGCNSAENKLPNDLTANIVIFRNTFDYEGDSYNNLNQLNDRLKNEENTMIGIIVNECVEAGRIREVMELLKDRNQHNVSFVNRAGKCD